jgi:hypothetical protein
VKVENSFGRNFFQRSRANEQFWTLSLDMCIVTLLLCYFVTLLLLNVIWKQIYRFLEELLQFSLANSWLRCSATIPASLISDFGMLGENLVV